jgi:hypothetical protein
MRFRDLKKGMLVKYNSRAHREFKCDKKPHNVTDVWEGNFHHGAVLDNPWMEVSHVYLRPA